MTVWYRENYVIVRYYRSRPGIRYGLRDVTPFNEDFPHAFSDRRRYQLRSRICRHMNEVARRARAAGILP